MWYAGSTSGRACVGTLQHKAAAEVVKDEVGGGWYWWPLGLEECSCRILDFGSDGDRIGRWVCEASKEMNL